MRRLPLLLLLLVVGCAHAPPSAPAALQRPPEAPEPAPVEVTIEHLPERDGWRVRYAFPAAQPQVVFGRGGRSTRARWKVLEPADATLLADGERGVVRRAAGAPIDALVLELEDDIEKPEKNYQPVIPYGDGGRLFYTGYIDLDIPNDVFFTFVPRAGEHVVARGQRSDQPLRTDWVQNGTYAYFGKTEPRVTEAGLAVIDGAMPAWLREELERALPAFLAFYAEGTRQPLPTRPVIFMSYTEDAQSAGSRSFGGGVLPGIVQLDVRLGANYRTGRNPLVLRQALWLAAHEGAHLWNSDLFSSEEEPGAEWLYEGGADAFALRALQKVGAATAEQTRESYSVALSLCLAGLGEGALRDSSRAGAWRNHYECGETLALLTEAAVRRKHPEADLRSFWAALFARAKERRYDSALYLETLQELGGAEAAAALRSLLEARGPGVEQRWREALRSVGLETVRDDAAMPEEVRLAISTGALRRLAQQDCEADGEARALSQGAYVGGSGCRTLPPRARVVRVGELAWDRGPAVHAAIAARCAKGAAVRLTLEGGRTLEVPCQATLPPAPGYVRLSGAAPEAAHLLPEIPPPLATDGYYERIERVAPHVWVIRQAEPFHVWPSGNVTVFEQSEGLVLLDAGNSPAAGERIIELLASVSAKPVKYVVISHPHTDHFLGLPALKRRWPGATVMATAAMYRDLREYDYWKTYESKEAQTRERYRKDALEALAAAQKPGLSEAERLGSLQTARELAQYYRDREGARLVLPEKSFGDRLVLPDAVTPVELRFLGKANTKGDGMLWAPRQRVLASGDAVVSPVPYGFNIYVREMLGVLERAEALRFRTLVPGHGRPMHDAAYLHRLAESLRDAQSQVARLVARGLSEEQVLQQFDRATQRRLFRPEDAWRERYLEEYWVTPMVKSAFREAKGLPHPYE